MSISPVLGQAEPTPDGHAWSPTGGSAGIQPHGFLLVVREGPLRIVQASTSAGTWLQRPLSTLLLATLHDLGGDIAARVAALAANASLDEPQPLHCRVGAPDGGLMLEGAVHRPAPQTLMVELQAPPGTDHDHPHAPDVDVALPESLAAHAQHFASTAHIAGLAQVAADSFRALFGHDRVTFCRCDDDGHAVVVAESRGGWLPPWPCDATGLQPLVPHEALLALRHRAQACADTRAAPSELVPRLLPGGLEGSGGAPDLTLCGLRSPSAAQAALWRTLGAVGTLQVSVVREGRLWGVLHCHHPQPRPMGYGQRLAAELLAEVLATRIAALQSYARGQVTAQAQRLEERLLDATAAEGDWRRALFRDTPALLKPLAASGAVLHHEGEWMRCGQTPETRHLPPLLTWLQQAGTAGLRHCAALPDQAPALAALSPQAHAALAVPLTASGADWLVWLRERPAGDATAAAAAADWTSEQLALAEAYGRALGDIIVQVNAVRLLIAQRQLVQVRGAVAHSQEAVVVIDAAVQAFYANDAFYALAGRQREECDGLDALEHLFTEPQAAHRMVGQVRAEQRPWQGEMSLRRPGGATLPVSVRAEPVPGQDGALLGTIFIFEDLTATKHAQAARSRFEAQVARAGRALRHPGTDELARAILANVSLAGMDISEGGAPRAVAPMLEEVQASAERAAALLARIRRNDAG